MAASNDKVLESIPPVMLESTYTFYMNHPLVQQCRQVLQSGLFPESWHVGWTDEKLAGSGAMPMLFNTPIVRSELQKFLLEALDRLRVHRVVTFWYYKNPAAWFGAMVKATSLEEHQRIGLPFGLLPLGDTRIETVAPSAHAIYERVFRVRPIGGNAGRRGAGGDADTAAAVSRRYKFGMFDTGLQLLPLTQAELNAAEDVVSEYRDDVTLSSEGWTRDCRKPATPVYSFMTRAAEVDLAQRNLIEADWQRSHPRIITRAKPPDAARITPDQIGDNHLYSADATFAAASNMLRQQGRASFHEWQVLASKMKKEQMRALDMARGRKRKRAQEETPRAKQKAHYEMPDAWDDQIELPDFVEVADAPTPDVLQDAFALQQQLRNDLLAFMGVPEAILSRGSRSGGGGSSKGASSTLTGERSSEMHALYYFEQAVSEQRATMVKFFTHVWLTVFGQFEMAMVDTTLARIEMQIAEREQEIAAAKAAAAAQAAEEKKEDKDENAVQLPAPAAAAAPVAEGDEKLERLKLNATEVRAWLMGVRTRALVRHEAEATLVFPGERTLQQTEDFGMTMDLWDRGMVAVPAVQQQLNGVMGRRAPELREPPPPPPEPPGPDGKPKKKKQEDPFVRPGKRAKTGTGVISKGLESTPQSSLLMGRGKK